MFGLILTPTYRVSLHEKAYVKILENQDPNWLKKKNYRREKVWKKFNVYRGHLVIPNKIILTGISVLKCDSTVSILRIKASLTGYKMKIKLLYKVLFFSFVKVFGMTHF